MTRKTIVARNHDELIVQCSLQSVIWNSRTSIRLIKLREPKFQSFTKGLSGSPQMFLASNLGRCLGPLLEMEGMKYIVISNICLGNSYSLPRSNERLYIY
jgi:hypothetical protein